MIVSILVAVSENGVIGRDGDMPWHLGSDLRRFRLLTMGHHLVMGRRTFESIGRVLPGRTTIVMTRDPEWTAEGVQVATNLDQALALAADDSEVFVVGGGEIYRLALPRAQRVYLTRVHAVIDGDTTFPPLDRRQWRLTGSESGKSDGQNDYDYTFEIHERLGNPASAGALTA
jgi:dihydrofolate reductase